MVYAGARGESEKEMAKALHFDLDQKQLHPAFGALTSHLILSNRKGGNELSIANNLWGQEGTPFNESYLTLARDNYFADISTLDFDKSPAQASRVINEWVSDKTKGQITDSVNNLPANTRLLVTSAVYLKADWLSKFLTSDTQDVAFFISKDKKVRIPTMCQQTTFRFYENVELQLLELPYQDSQLAMIVLLPKSMDPLDAFEQTLTLANLNIWLEQAKPQEIKVLLPKFQITSQFDLKQHMMHLGMKKSFLMPDLSGMSPIDIILSDIKHDAKIEVNESGTVAAAVTEESFTTCIQEKAKIFCANHPFVFMIRDVATGSIFFIGRVVNPEEN
jgi:serpin B